MFFKPKMFSMLTGDKELYYCPKCGHLDTNDAAEGFLEKGDNAWDCSKCGERVTIRAASVTAHLSEFDQFLNIPKIYKGLQNHNLYDDANKLRFMILAGKITGYTAMVEFTLAVSEKINYGYK
jgi:predicted RNA-binding Zn-ribbon protein involved in translation (DUF1610 family)